jgi:hypothetical protein
MKEKKIGFHRSRRGKDQDKEFGNILDERNIK